MSQSQGRSASLHVYRAMLTDSVSKYVLAYDDEDAAWQAYRLAKQLDNPLLNVSKHGYKATVLRQQLGPLQISS